MTTVPKTTHELLVRGASEVLDFQREDGSFPPGRGGGYGYEETPVRTTSHWLTILSRAYEITQKQKFEEAAIKAASYLLDDARRPHGYTFHARDVENKDRCDGLVGQAAPIRGLSYAAQMLQRPDLFELAETVHSLHPFDKSLGLWERVETDGSCLSFDRTLNHQIIFAASTLPLTNYSNRAAQTCLTFLDRLSKSIDLGTEGLPRHYVRPPISDVLTSVARNPRNWPLLWNELTIHYHARSDKHRQKEIGYYLVITSQLASLKRAWPTHDVWESQTIQNLLSFRETSTYNNLLVADTDFGTAFPWIDHAITELAFGDPDLSDVGQWIGRSVEREFDPQSGLLTRTADDPHLRGTVIGYFAPLPDIELIVDEAEI